MILIDDTLLDKVDENELYLMLHIAAHKHPFDVLKSKEGWTREKIATTHKKLRDKPELLDLIKIAQ